MMKINRIQICLLAPSKRLSHAPITSVPAGYPSPAQDYSDTKIDLSEMLIRDQVSTFIVRVSGGSMEGSGISDGDELIMDRSIKPRDGHVVIAVIDGEMTVKRLALSSACVVLKAENPDYEDITVAELSEMAIWGVATTCLYHLE
jgi:DNA polymerase V